ncbi:hypothetical protein WR25_07419 [Diploscapter pachys]|uniref:DNA replication licensing factor MCM3 n=1 Tax=Diploscapter pachys TaxID=2018661 RepID=A0A2A2KY16_9BILA|nr:hypothetical protein WR25_07419 [Diploscapter pachys]
MTDAVNSGNLANFGLVDKAEEARNREVVHEYLNFLDDSTEGRIYVQKIDEMIQEGQCRLIVSLDDVRRRLPQRAHALIRNFVDEILCIQQAARDMLQRASPDFATDKEIYVGFEGTFGDRHVNPRTLKSNFLGNMVCCEGIVTKCSTVRPKVVRSVHYCPATKKTLERKYTDLTSYEAFPSSNVYPTEDENKNPLETEFGLSTYKDHQTFSIQELPETAPAGQLPRSVDVIADDDLADRVKPGDRVRVVGLYRVLPNKQNGFSSGSFRSILISNNIQLLSKDLNPDFEPDDVKNIRKISRRKDVFELLARSLAPSISGHEEVKQAILCLLLGGLEKNLENGTRLRGDINVLLIGDPSVAKSQLLRYVLHTAPRAVATTGRGSSGVGLTAAVTTDAESGERRLEAGAMVLADRGVVCIDEFDKMSDIDRTAIHEVMEQGRVTIAKAGIHATLNARCSVLAAANPIYGRYDPFKSPMENIAMQDSLLSRFDLIFVLLDEHEANRDRAVANHVINIHRYRTPGEPDGTVLPMGNGVDTLSTFDLDSAQKASEIWEKNTGWTSGGESQKILSMAFLKKYIHFAKGVKPKLTDEAREFISDAYAEIRSFDTSRTDKERTMAVTARQLETLIRLSTSIAKARFSKTVDYSDAEMAYHLLHFACFKEKPKARIEFEKAKEAKRRGSGHWSGGEEEEEEMDVMDVEESESQATSTQTRRGRRRRAVVDDDELEENEENQPPSSQPSQPSQDTDEPATSQPPKAKRAKSSVPAISVDRYKAFKKTIRKAFDELPPAERDDMVELNAIIQKVQSQMGNLTFSGDEVQAALEMLESENAAMVNDDKIILI